jgi:hypothetical protein
MHVCWYQWQVVTNFGLTFHWAVHQARNFSGGWGTASVFYITNGTSTPTIGTPTIASTPNMSTVMMWSVNNSVMKAVGDMNNSWSGSQFVESANYPALGIGTPMSTPSYVSNQMVPSLYKINSNAMSIPKTDLTASKRYYARVLMGVDTVTGQTFSVRMTEPRVGKKQMRLAAVNDTLPGITTENFFNYLASDPVQVETANDTLEFALSISQSNTGENPLPISLSIDGMNEQTKVGSLLSVKSDFKEKETSFGIRKALKNFRGKKFQLKPAGKLPVKLGKNWIFNLAHVYTTEQDTISLAKEQLTEEFVLPVPTIFALDQNYPNPFNPSTTISYQLPAVSSVSMKVYDMLGREVATLVDGLKEAGYVTATFNASHLASGAYFVRFTATPQDGSKPFNQTMKMLMTK